MIQSLSIASHIKPRVWRCEQCGLTRPIAYRIKGRPYLRKSRTCSQVCHGLLVSGPNNPAYIDGRKKGKGGKSRPPMQEWQMYMIRKWDENGSILTGQQLADVLGIARGTIYRYLRRTK